MKKKNLSLKYIICSVLLMNISMAEANFNQQIPNTNTNSNQVLFPNQTPTINNNQPSLNRIINRIPRRYDRQTLINAGPGLLQETFFLFRGMGGLFDGDNNNNEADQVILRDDNVQAPIPPQAPQVPEILPELKIEEPPPSNPVIQTQPAIQNQQTNTQRPMLPAPAPGFIIRYNEERGVYEEVREIKPLPDQTF